MNTMKKYSMIILISLFSLNTMAQSFVLRGGFNLASIKISDADDDQTMNTKSHTGFNFGAFADFPINDFLSVETGLAFTKKGVNMVLEEDGYSFTNKVNLNYLSIPIALRAKKELGDNTSLYGSFGPYLAFGLSGKTKMTMEYQGQTEEGDSESIIWGSDPDEAQLKRFDFGLTFGAGVEFNSILLGLSYDLGLSNISAYQEDGAGLKNRVFSINVGYRF